MHGGSTVKSLADHDRTMTNRCRGSSNLCLFCYKPAIFATKESGNPEVNCFDKFFKSLDRFTGKDCFGGLRSGLSEWLDCCEDCRAIVDEFCDKFHKLRCLELELEWRLKTLVDIMREASRTPARVQRIKRMFDKETVAGAPRVIDREDGSFHEEEDVNIGDPADEAKSRLMSFKCFKNDLIKICASSLSKSQPRVLVTRLLEEESTAGPFSAAVSNEQDEDDWINDDVADRLSQVEDWDQDFSVSCSSTGGANDDAHSWGSSEMGSLKKNVPEVITSHPRLHRETKTRHRTIRSQESSSKKAYCQICSKYYASMDSLRIHRRKQHSSGTNRRPSQFRCTTCNIGFGHYESLRHHKLHSRRHQAKLKVASRNQGAKQQEEGSDETTPESFDDTLVKSEIADVDAMEMEASKLDLSQVMDTSFAREKPKRETFFCPLDGCQDKPRREKKGYEDHKKLHAAGEFKCNFCSVLESNVMKLSRHERIQHSSSNPDQSSSGSKSKKYFQCPRCEFGTGHEYKYEWHFAEKHIPGFVGRTNKRRENFVECDICLLKIDPTNKDKHFTVWHDTVGVDPEKLFNCDLEGCSAYFKQNYQISLHRRQVHFKSFPIPQIVDDNQVVEGEGQRFQCKLCSKIFSTLGYLQSHKIKYHTSDTAHPAKTCKNSLICPSLQCTQSFKTQLALENHQKLHGSFKCRLCDLEKDYAPDLALHEETDHNLTVKEETPETGATKLGIQCPRCLLSFSIRMKYTRHFLQEHLNLHDTGTPCPICQAPMATPTVKRRGDFMRHHFSSHHKIKGLDPSQIFKCDQCPAYFLQRNQLITHKMSIHFHGNCPVCHKTFERRGLLREHMLLEHPEHDALSELVFRCTVGRCVKRFGSQAELDNHMKECDLADIMQCSECGKQFRGKYNLRHHVRLMHGPANHVCGQCGKAFTSRGYLARHLISHEGPSVWKFQCPTCGKKFQFNSHLEGHMRQRHEEKSKGKRKEKPFPCQFCEGQFKVRRNWRNHMKRNHKEEYGLIETASRAERIARAKAKKAAYRKKVREREKLARATDYIRGGSARK